MNATELVLHPIGHVRTGMRTKYDAPPQPTDGVEQNNVIELLPHSGLQQALSDLAGFERIWLVWWFHKNKSWKPKVLPPRGPRKKRGVFATRSPHRPNPIGITSVRLIGVEKSRLVVGNLDLIDGTPILDIKPYLPMVDSFPSARAGWVEEVEIETDAATKYEIELQPRAQDQIAWLREHWNIDFTERAFAMLTRDPTPHRTRRIARCRDGSFQIACGAWRMRFAVSESKVSILEVLPGFPVKLLATPEYAPAPDCEAQRAFYEEWGERGK